MKTEVGKFSFKVPEGHENAGKKIEKGFEFRVCETVEEATEVINSKEWSVLDMVNETLKANARSNAYQSALLPYRPSEVPQEDIIERMVRDYIRMGVDENVARATVANLIPKK
jgi:hypothetical protein